MFQYRLQRATRQLLEQRTNSTLSKETRSRIQAVVSTFFKPEKTKVQLFDNKYPQKTIDLLTTEDRIKMKKILKEAKNSRKTFSTY